MRSLFLAAAMLVAVGCADITKHGDSTEPRWRVTHQHPDGTEEVVDCADYITSNGGMTALYLDGKKIAAVRGSVVIMPIPKETEKEVK